ncbi:MAG: aminoacyl-histidine dipeptidase [Bacteroidetes bacterium]|nr:aminoacyl-histidine dipeptidase [Bacteroidota bacterium]
MNHPFASLKPERLWYYFSEILKVPRPSKREEQITDYLVTFGNTHNLETIVDDIGNVIIKKKATIDKVNARTVILQSHMDMVCEKNNDKIHDFDHDPIEARIDSDWIKANGTTLGADDGIGIAAQLAILESDSIGHGPLECLFTTDEETGLTGAKNLDPSVLAGKVLLNLDSEDEGQLFIGCAGGIDTTIELEYKKEDLPVHYDSFKIFVNGLKGGHSGDEIDKGLGNANKILCRLLWMSTDSYGIRLAHFDGGNLRNAIAREAFANICLPRSSAEGFKTFVSSYYDTIKEELKLTDEGVNIYLEKIDDLEFIIDNETQSNLLNSLYACPHGVIAYSAEIPGFIETSTNLAAVKTFDNIIKITTSQRSSVESAKNDVANMVRSTFALTGADISHSEGYPGWQPNPDSEIVEIMVESYKNLFNQDPEVLAIHAGLECGLIGAIYPDMDMISFGPTIKGAHSPDERIHIESAVKFWDLLVDVLQKL